MQEKGGAWKTPFTINASSFAVSRGIEHEIVDCDVRATMMLQTFPKARILNVDERALEAGTSDLALLLDLLHQGRNLIVDTGANTRRCFNFFFEITRFGDRIRGGEFRCNIFCPVMPQSGFDRASHFFFNTLQKECPWANIVQVRIRDSLTYDPAAYPEHNPESTIVFPFIPLGIRKSLSAAALTLDQALQQKVFGDPIQRELVDSYKRDLYTQLSERATILF